MGRRNTDSKKGASEPDLVEGRTSLVLPEFMIEFLEDRALKTDRKLAGVVREAIKLLMMFSDPKNPWTHDHQEHFANVHDGQITVAFREGENVLTASSIDDLGDGIYALKKTGGELLLYGPLDSSPRKPNSLLVDLVKNAIE